MQLFALTTRTLDGYGRQTKTVASIFDENSQTWTPTTTYYIRSTVLGAAVLTELKESGSKHRTFVYFGGQLLATQEIIGISTYERVTWEHRDPSAATYRTTRVTGDIFESAELDPTGADAGLHAPLIPLQEQDEGTGSLLPYPSFSNPSRPGVSYAVDHIRVSIDYFRMALDSAFHSSLGLAESATRASSRVVGYRLSGVLNGRPFDVTYGAKDRIVSWWEGNYDELAHIAGDYVDEMDIYGSSSWSLLASLMGAPQNSGLTPVGNETSQKLNTALGRLGLALESGVSKECQEKVLDQIALTGLNVIDFIAFLDRGANFYNGERSSATVAGNVGPLAWSNGSFGKGATISGVFRSRPGLMALSSFVNTTLTVFFREDYVNQMNESRLQAFLFHEGLHAYGQGDFNYSDQRLKAAFGIAESEPSESISDYIYRHCFR